MDLTVSKLTLCVCCSDDYENRSNRTRSRSNSSYERRRHRQTRRSRTPRRRRLSSPSLNTEYSRYSNSPSDENQTKEKGGVDLEEAPLLPMVTPEVTPVTNEIPAHIEGLLGQEGAPPSDNSIELHESLTKRWMAILQTGLEAETKASILIKHNPPKNCGLLVPPLLNEEVAAAMNENGVKRDKRITENQTVLSAAITTIGKVLNSMIATHENEQYIENLSDAARLLCDLYHENSTTRRSLILPGLNKDLKDLMGSTPICEYLFGDKLQDKVNAVKAVKKSGLELKNTPPQQKVPKRNNLNYRGPQRPQVPRPSGQKPRPKQTAHQTYYPNKLPTRGRRSPQKFQRPRRQVQDRRGR